MEGLDVGDLVVTHLLKEALPHLRDYMESWHPAQNSEECEQVRLLIEKITKELGD